MNKKVKNQVSGLEAGIEAVGQGEWEYEGVRFFVRKHSYRPILGEWVPHLEVVSNYGEIQVVPFIGEVLLDVSKERYCLECYRRVELDRNICVDCIERSELYFLNCVIIGAGLGKGWCNLEEPVCGSEFSKNYCLREHAVYIAQFGNDYIKVGVSRRDRVWERLIEQGVSRAQVFVGNEKLNLVSAQLLETCIVEYFKLEDITDHLEFERKLPCFMNEPPDLETERLDRLGREIMKVFNLKTLFQEDFRKYYKFIEIDEFEYDAGRICGEIVGYRGNIFIYRDMEGIVKAFDANSMAGRCLLNVKG